MEAVGLAISIISLAGIFKDCIDLFSMISTTKSMEKDYRILSVKLDIEKTLLLQWAEHVRLVHEDYDRRLDNPTMNRTVARILGSIKDLLSDGSELEHRRPMFCAKAKGQVSKRTTSTKAQDSQKHKVTLKEKFYWAVRDKEKFGSLIRDLSGLVRGLNLIVPQPQWAQWHSDSLKLLKQDVQHVRLISRLELLMDAAKNHDKPDPFTDMIQAQIDQRCQQRILDNLWYRMLDHRKNSVSEAHPGTFGWALRPPTDDVEWDDLSQWFQSGTGIYWIHGKPGSGKTTLMKHLYDEPLTHSLLFKWAKDKPLSMPHFFFWNLGTPEQKTQYGLYRGLLYYIFQEDPSLIQDLLPEMWREAHDDRDMANQTPTPTGSLSLALNLPMEEEMISAFSRLKFHSRAAFCFFIDGLDEYSGDPIRLTAFLEKLVSNNIKAVISSRIIPSCVQAFSHGPKLRLQDLTRGDIKLYAHDIIARHPHTETILEMDSTIVDTIQSELSERADGVFLWVVLACRSLIQGFAAYDDPEELKQRLNELPPELDDLFKHILQGFDPRYYEQAAKLLRLCFHSTRLRIDPDDPHDGLSTLGLALADAEKFDITRPLQFNHLSQRERARKCILFEARLRSRCCGLLEIRLGYSGRCFCQSRPLLDAMHGGGQIVDSTVEFIHRTVFDFLKAPGVWDYEYLQVRDETFYADAILSRMNAHLVLASMYVIRDSPSNGPDQVSLKHMLGSVLHLSKMDSRLKDECTVFRGQALSRAVLDIANTLKMLVTSAELEAELRGLSDQHELHLRISKTSFPDLAAKLVCELGMETAIR